MFGFATLITSSIALYKLQNDLPTTILEDVDEIIRTTAGLGYNDLTYYSVSAAGLGVGIGLAVVVCELLIICLRFINIGLINYKIKVFLLIVS